MREVLLVKKLNQAYCALDLKYSKLILAFFFMFITSILEMLGLSILYPLILAMGGHGQVGHSDIFSILPLSLSPSGQILFLFFGVAVLFLAKNVALYFTYNNNIQFAVYCYKNLISGLYHAYINKPVLEFQKESAGSLASIICVQTSRLIDGVLRPLLVVVTELFVLIGICILLLFISPGLIITAIVVCGIAGGVFYALFRNAALKWGDQRMQASSSLQELVNNTSVGISEIKIFGKEYYLTSRVSEAASSEANMFHHLEMYQQAPRYIIETVFIVTLVLSFSVLLAFGASPSILLAQFSVIAAASFRILPSINRIVNSYSNFSFNISPALSLLDTVSELKFLTKTQDDKKNKHCGQLTAKLIELKNITFKYSLSDKLILENINLSIKKGERVGIIGSSGSGKSTLIEILAGLYMPFLGEVVVDDQPIMEVLDAWQASIGYVPQMSFIMPGTIEENIVFGADDFPSAESVWRVLRTVGLANFVISLPKGINTEIGEKGVALSGGQKQLICMARALLRNPSIFLLDEPTASLDVMNEKIVLEAINNLSRDTTVVMVSHKQENFNNFDSIYICEQGKINKKRPIEIENMLIK